MRVNTTAVIKHMGQQHQEITLYDLTDSEIEIIDGWSYIIVEAENRCVNIPLILEQCLNQHKI